MIPAASVSHSVWLRVGTLFDGDDRAPGRDAHVVYDAQGIRFVGTDGRFPPPDRVRPGQTGPDAHLPDHTLLPGLTDAHAHLFLEGGELDPEQRARSQQLPPADLLARAQTRLERLVQLGVLAVRDAGDRDGVGLALSRQYRAGPGSRPLMPYLESPGAAIHRRGRYGSFMGEPLEAHASLHACVQARIAAGADRIKLIPTGIINFKQGAVTSEPQMSTAEIAEIVAAARAFGRQTFAHASGDSGIDRVIDGGVDTVEHGYFLRDDQLARLRDRDQAWVPTFAPVQKQVEHAERLGWDATVLGHLRRILDGHAASLVRAHARGVRVIAGSDAGSYGVAHGYGLFDELEAMERAGLSPRAVLHAATGAGAARLGFHEPIGRIAPGYRSRFVLTDRPVLAGIKHLRDPRMVVFDGNVYEVRARVDPRGL